MTRSPAWEHSVAWAEALRGPIRLRLAAAPEVRSRVAALLDLEDVARLTADLLVRPWLDGVEIDGRLEATVTRLCGLTLEPFDQWIEEAVRARIVPPGSPHAPAGEGHEVIVDLEADDPPDIGRGETIDVAAYVVESLSLALDPFPRKPGAVFEAPAASAARSPFAALAGLRGKPEGD